MVSESWSVFHYHGLLADLVNMYTLVKRKINLRVDQDKDSWNRIVGSKNFKD